MTAVEQAIAEIDERLATFGPELEGLRDYDRLNLKPETKNEVDGAIADYERRTLLLTTAKSALQALMSDGHPSLDTRKVSLSIYNDLAENKRTIDAALAKFTTDAATGLGLAGGAVQPK